MKKNVKNQHVLNWHTNFLVTIIELLRFLYSPYQVSHAEYEIDDNSYINKFKGPKIVMIKINFLMTFWIASLSTRYQTAKGINTVSLKSIGQF